MLTPAEIAQEAAALQFAKAHKAAIANRLTDREFYCPEDQPVSVFMAGSPGAGKTEASKRLIAAATDGKNNIIRIDPDELREELPGYNGQNSFVFQKAVSVLVDRIHDLALKYNQSFLLDGTLSKYDKSDQNIERSLKRRRVVQILYVYQSPPLAWKFVCARELVEGRKIRPDHFIEQYFGAKDVVNALKEKFGGLIKVDLLVKANDNSHLRYKANIDRIEHYIPELYTPQMLRELIKEGVG